MKGWQELVEITRGMENDTYKEWRLKIYIYITLFIIELF